MEIAIDHENKLRKDNDKKLSQEYHILQTRGVISSSSPKRNQSRLKAISTNNRNEKRSLDRK